MKQNHLFILGIIFLSIFSCKSAKESVLQFQTTAPFEMVEPYYNAWVGGIESAGSGVNVFLPLKEDLGRVTVDSIHFRGEKSAVVKRDQLEKTVVFIEGIALTKCRKRYFNQW